MAGLAEDSLERPSAGRRIAVVAGVLAALLLLGALAWWLKGQLSTPSTPKRQVARISILPDTPPPPPPPPPKEVPRPQPSDDTKPPPPDVAPKPQVAPAPADAPIKMEGAAGSGDSPFAAGNVSREYQGGAPTIGGTAARSAAPVVDRARQQLYASTTRPLLREAIERHLRAEATELTAEFTLWLAADGAISRFELVPGTDAQADAALQAALDETRRSLRLPAPPNAMRPMRFKLVVQPQG